MMTQTPNHERFRMLYQMLFEMATGNLTYRIKNYPDDEFDELTTMLNTLAAKMQTTALQLGFVKPHYSYQGLIQTTIILNSDFDIQSFSANVPKIFGYSALHLFAKDFAEIVSPQTLPIWVRLQQEIIQDEHFHNTVQLIFITATKRLIPTFCTISKLLYSDRIIISSVTTVLQDNMADFARSAGTDRRTSDAEMVQNVYEYIKKHLEDPLPSTKELSLLFGTNEFKLKDSFKNFFQTSIHQFYNEERLKKAHLLIQQSVIPVKTIAYMCGFNSYINFYKAFKKRFQYAPTDLARPTNQPDTSELE